MDIYIAYKYMPIADGIVVVFEEPIKNFEKGVNLSIAEHNNLKYLAINESHLINISDGIVNNLERTDNIYVAHSAKNEYGITIQGAIQVDKILVGKIIAYSEIQT